MTAIASRTQLPPSPELNAVSSSSGGGGSGGGGGDPPMFGLSGDDDDDNNNNTPAFSRLPRLRSVARYASYRPQTLATSDLLPSFRTSLGAVAGSHGVAIFRVSEPQTPLALLNHHSSSTSLTPTFMSSSLSSPSSSGIGTLCFQPDPQCLLAGTRGSAVLIWDTGVGPLTDRCEAPTSEPLSSLAWRSPRILTASTPSVACLWDVRTHHAQAANRSKPTLRFGALHGGGGSVVTINNNSSPYVQIANNGDHQVALLDAGGILRIWDWRYIEEQGGSKAMDTIQAFRSVGVGLAPIPSSSSWVVWGYERVNEGAVAKVLTPKSSLLHTVPSGSVMEDLTQESIDYAGYGSYVELGLLQTPKLACVRVQEDHLVTLGVGVESWQADVWKVNATTSVDPIVSFQSSRNFGAVCAADLALSSFPRLVEEGSQGIYSQRTSGLLLVNLTEDGYVTTHSIPEAMESLPASESKDETNSARPSKSLPPTAATRIIPDDRDVGDVALAWGSKPDSTDDRGRTGDDMPFDMDVPVAYSIASTDVQQLRRGEITSPTGTTVVAGAQDGIDEAPVRLNIDARRIPCPRLCGATFATGGGLAVFGNGEVKRMWTWYSTSLNREDGEFSGRRAIAAGEKRRLRTMHDLQNMMKKAKEAQWGEHSDGETSSVASQQLGLGFFDDESDDESSDSVEADSDDNMVDIPGEKDKGMYESYFGDFRRPLTRTSSGESRLVSTSDSRISSDTMGGPSSDVLQPVVKVSRAFDKMSMNHQSRELALAWKLGDFDVDCLHDNAQAVEDEIAIASGEGLPRIPSALSPPRFLNPGHNRIIAQSPRQQSGMFPSTSDQVISPPKASRSKANSKNNAYDMDETGVHGGAYPRRPQVKESVVFLKKLVNYQQESAGYRGLTSPPDGPNVNQRTQKPARPQINSPVKQGAYVLRRPKASTNNNLEAIKLACEHNSKISAQAGEHEKAETWKLLGQAVDGRIDVAGGGRWRPKSSVAMSSNIVRLVLKYYEKAGDVQMLSTIVCVLRQEKMVDTAGGPPLLPEDTRGQYDCYLRRYADLLYSWGLLSLRAQLNKRLRFVFESREVFGVPSMSKERGGIAIFTECPHCHQPTTTNYCHSCSNYAFRCILCDTAVRGLFTVCGVCGHGGHINHLHDWFETQKECPTGCGCHCTLWVPQPEQQGIGDRSLV